MEMNNSFEVTCPIDEAWTVLTDVERIAPCLPGARLTGVEGSKFQGIVKVKVGPITSQYRGTAEFAERDDAAHRAVISAKGRDTRGAGNASAKITAQLEAVDAGTTRVDVHTNLMITGKVAQFGRGVMADVSARLMRQFADNLADMITASREEAEPGGGESDGEAGSGSDSVSRSSDAEPEPSELPAGAADSELPAGAADSEPSTTSSAGSTPGGGPGADSSSASAAGVEEPEAVDLLSVAGAPVLKRLAPLLIAVAVVVVFVVFRGRCCLRGQRLSAGVA